MRETISPFRVFLSDRENRCAKCSRLLEKGHKIALFVDRTDWCLICAGISDLIYVPSGDAALTRRACHHSKRSHIVLWYSRSRKRNERQGVLVEQNALDIASEECEADFEKREVRREKEGLKRAECDREYEARFARRIQELYPYCPSGRELEIAKHACEKGSGRVGRIAAAKTLQDYTINLAVRAHIRHQETEYDKLLAQGFDRKQARESCEEQIDATERTWKTGPTKVTKGENS